MPTYQLTGPDGKKYRITGDSPEGAVQALQQHLGQSAAPASQFQQEAAPDTRDNPLGSIDTFMRGAADTLSFGLADEIAAGGDALFNPIFGTGQDGGSISDRYNANLDAQRGTDELDARNRTAARLLGQITGGVGGGIGLAKNGLSLSANAINRGANLARVSAASAGEGAILGGAHGLGSGEGLEGRLFQAGVGGISGLALGGATPAVVAGAGKALKTAVAPIAARINPESYARDALATGLRRSGRTPDQIAEVMQAAVEDGQKGYAVADALGHTGQRLASTIARNPSEERQAFVEFLQRRQSGQADRLTNALAEGFDSFDTAAQRAAALTDARDAVANRAYAQARKEAGSIDLSGVIQSVDDYIRPGVQQLVSPTDDIAGDSIEKALSTYRNRMTDGRSVLTDFNRALTLKQDVSDAVLSAQRRGEGNKARVLGALAARLDEALESASPAYRQANDMFKRQSETVDAVEAGTKAASGRTRAEDNIPAFGALPSEDQAAFRAGYVDPLIAKIEAQAIGPGTNKARVLASPKTQQEFQAFAAPGKAKQLGHRVGREQRMFDTYTAALGNSKTADNMADAADLNQYDPSIIGGFATGGITGGLAAGFGRLMNEAKGMPPSVVDRLARAIMETDPEMAREILMQSGKKMQGSDQLRALIGSGLLGSTASVPGRL